MSSHLDEFEVEFFLESDSSKHLVKAKAGDKLHQVALRAGIHLQTTCGGKASCGDCRVRVEKGLKDGLQDPSFAEKALIGNVSHITKERLACQSILKGPVSVKVPPKKVRVK